MRQEHEIVEQVYAAKSSMEKADDLIGTYIPFIKAEVSRYLKRVCTEQDDEFSIAMIAFHEAIRGFTRDRGAFLKFAALLIRSRLTDYLRKEARHRGHLSIDEAHGEEEAPLHERLADDRDHAEETAMREATRQEIEELQAVMAGFGLALSDVVEHSPKQERTLEACRQVIRYAADNADILDELLQTKKLPMNRLVAGTGVERKTLERHRKYILVMMLIQTNGYEIIRGHLRHVMTEKGGSRK